MAIIFFGGLPGSGKSYGVVENVFIPAFEKGRTVVTNIPLHEDIIKLDYPNASIIQIKLEQISSCEISLFDLPKGSIIALDEIYTLWPSGTKSNEIPKEHREFFAKHRHIVDEHTGFSTQIVLVSQNQAQIASFLRNLIDRTYNSKKLNVLGSSKSYNINIYDGKVPDIDKAKQSDIIRRIKGRYKPQVFQYYQSHTHSDENIVGNEESADDRANIFKSARFTIVIPSLLIMTIFAFKNLANFMGAEEVEQLKQSKPIQQQIKPEVRQKPIVLRPTNPLDPKLNAQPKSQIELSKTWYITGFIESKKLNQALIHNGFTLLRIDFKNHCTRPYKNTPDIIECIYNDERITQWTGQKRREQSFATAPNIPSN